MELPREIEGRWQTGVVLKRDVLSSVERGRFLTDGGAVEAVLRRIDEVPWWSFVLARHLFGRERRALAAAKSVLRKLHRAGICHNDLAKEQNWLRGNDGRAYVTDFQLAIMFKHRNLLFRIAAYEDLRHLLKHKLRYAPEAISAAERRVLARKSFFTKAWMATGKRVYQWVTRDILRFTDREGGGPRLVYDAPRIAAHLKSHPQVREVTIVAYPDRRAGTGLYAFVEGAPALSERVLRDFMAGGDRPKPPEHLQVIEQLPRRASGEVRSEILQLVAMNQLDLIDALISSEPERLLIQRILADRRNLLDRFAF
jgi:serine/threonine protein kinase